MGFPLFAVPFVNAVVFAFHELTKRVLGFHDENEMNIYEGMICGGIAGLANCIVVTPVELVKCRLQIQFEEKKNNYYKGVIDCLKKIIKNEGWKAIYKGNVATIYREIPAYAAQFGGYYYSKQLFAKFRNKKVEDLGHADLMISGSIGGYACWQFSYPQDVIKTLLQIDKKGTYKNCRIDGGFYQCSKDLYREKGFSGFWKGYGPCMLRAVTANAILFVTYENVKLILSKYHDKLKN